MNMRGMMIRLRAARETENNKVSLSECDCIYSLSDFPPPGKEKYRRSYRYRSLSGTTLSAASVQGCICRGNYEKDGRQRGIHWRTI